MNVISLLKIYSIDIPSSYRSGMLRDLYNTYDHQVGVAL